MKLLVDFWVARRPRSAALFAVAAVHSVVLWMLAASMRFQVFPTRTTEIQLDFLSPNMASRGIPAPPIDWDFEVPEKVVVPEPQIAITPDQEGGEGIVAQFGVRVAIPAVR